MIKEAVLQNPLTFFRREIPHELHSVLNSEGSPGETPPEAIKCPPPPEKFKILCLQW